VRVKGGIREHLVDRHRFEIRVADEAVPVHECAFHGFHQQVVIVRAAFSNRAEIEALERAHDLQGRDALRGWAHAHQFAAAIGDA
jgi:hypothetical protein